MTDEVVDLAALPPTHPLRNIALIDIGAFYRNKNAAVWREVFPSFGIARKTFNQLDKAWTTWDIWKATQMTEMFE